MKVIKFVKKIDETELPLVEVTDGNFKGMHFLVDTGCSQSIILMSAADEYGKYIMTDGHKTTLYGMDGVVHEVLVGNGKRETISVHK